MSELSIEEREFNLNKRIALFENRLDMQCSMLQKNFDEITITDIQKSIDAQARFIRSSLFLLRNAMSIKQQKFNRFQSGGIISKDIEKKLTNY